MDNLPVASSKSGGAMWLVWLVPLSALAVVGWMLFSYYADTKAKITITFNNGSGIVEGKTALMHRGIRVGTVSDVMINKSDMQRVDVVVSIRPEVEDLVAKKGSQFVKVEPKVSFAEVSGLDTIISGVYIELFQSAQTVEEASSQHSRYSFVGIDKKPIQKHKQGLYLTLSSDNGALGVNTPVLYKEFIVGKIVDKNLTKDSVNYLLYIKDEYQDLVKNSSDFWQMDSIELEASLSGIKLNIGSIASLLSGAVTFSSPSQTETLTKRDYILYKNYDAVKLDDRVLCLTLHTDDHADPQTTDVYYKDLKAGKIINTSYDAQSKTTTLFIKLNREYRELANKKARFFIQEPELDLGNLGSISSLLAGARIAFETSDNGAEIEYDFKLYTIDMIKNDNIIYLTLPQADGVKVNTKIYYRGVHIGRVVSLKLEKDMDSLKAVVELKNGYITLINDSSLFYVDSAIEFELSMQKMQLQVGSLQSMMSSGITLETVDLKAPKTKNQFKLYKSRLDLKRAMQERRSKKIVLTTQQLDSISIGTPLLYKELKIGEVVDLEYKKDEAVFALELYVEDRYSDLINSSSVFMKNSSFELDVDISSFSFKSSNISNLLQPSISLQSEDLNASATNKSHFRLYSPKEKQDEDYSSFVIYIAGKSEVKVGSSLLYKQLKIGEVEALELDMDVLKATLLIKKEYEHLLHKDSWFYAQEFSLSLDGVENASSALFGSPIVLVRGSSSSTSSSFTLSPTPPPPSYAEDGLRVVLVANSKSSLDVGSPIEYRQVAIGQIESFKLSKDRSTVELTAFIEPQFADLLRVDSIFYIAGKMEIDVGFSGIEVRAETLKTMLSGAVAVVPSDSNAKRADDYSRFKLYEQLPKK